MSQETDAVAAVAEDAEVMASVETGPAGETFILADITRDDAYVTAPLQDAATLPEWR
ncbi:DUF7556 family protein [Halapricum desulfuricans]|uniref:Uncharacterized protein n=1 Tax=Halapricum desulfuricans TaxID=2841257 RepID=A0A897N4V7_9EURY|nr:hypothetical protein [Halapricum desulfuricans]QSG07902.1 Uncharacterized protein HSR122_0495 [Halapricum desulfuricans]QSG12974.1 Uncharacterized protein HSBGL_2570 [Halapricum desulfuricans]